MEIIKSLSERKKNMPKRKTVKYFKFSNIKNKLRQFRTKTLSY